MVEFCNYCKCLILKNGKCRNSDCILGAKNSSTINQRILINQLMEEIQFESEDLKLLNIPDDIVEKQKNEDLTKDEAGILIKILINYKDNKQIVEEM